MRNNTYIVIVISLLCLFSCKKKNKDTELNASNSIVLDTPLVMGSNVLVKWSEVENDQLTGYQLYRRNDTGGGGFWSVIILGKADTQYVDTLTSFPFVQYYVQALVPGNKVVSNQITYVRPDVDIISITPQDALFDRTARMIYIYSKTGEILSYDVALHKTLNRISTGSDIGFCSLGEFKGKKELYVPRKDGWIFIYDAATLTQIDQLNIGIELYSVQCTNGKLFVSHYSNPNSLEVYDREAKTKLWEKAENDLVRLIPLPGTNTEMLGVSAGANKLHHYYFDASGTLDTQYIAGFSNMGASPASFELFPDGTRYITSSVGTIISNSMVYISALPRGNMSFTSFDFNNTDGLIYAGCKLRFIQSFFMNNYQLSKTTPTIGFPVKVFFDNGTVLSVSTSTDPLVYYPSISRVSFIERIDGK